MMRLRDRLWRNSGPAFLFAALVILTIGAICAVYGNTYFHKWPWFRASVVLSLITCLWPFAVRKTKGLGLLESVVYACLILCVEIFLVYPGYKSLGLRSDSRLLPLWTVLSVLHGAGTVWDSDR
jgi:peptidoglycan/LPS O-acetylase OafA/YrhL